MLCISALSSVLGGTILGMLLILSRIQAFIEADILLPSIVLGCVIVATVLLRRNRSFKHTIIRTMLMFMCCYVAIRLFAVMGIVEYFDNLLLIQWSESSDRVAGLMMAILLIIFASESILINVVLLIYNCVTKCKTGDGSLS